MAQSARTIENRERMDQEEMEKRMGLFAALPFKVRLKTIREWDIMAATSEGLLVQRLLCKVSSKGKKGLKDTDLIRLQLFFIQHKDVTLAEQQAAWRQIEKIQARATGSDLDRKRRECTAKGKEIKGLERRIAELLERHGKERADWVREESRLAGLLEADEAEQARLADEADARAGG